MPAKKPNPRQWWINFYSDQRQRALLVGEEFPNISLISLELEYYSMNNPAAVIRETVPFKPNDKAFFHLDCKDRDCVAGGFDFSALIRESITEPISDGDLHCSGNTEFSKIKTIPCDWHVRFKVNVVPVSNQSR